MKQKFYVLIGPPAVGKSTYVKNNFDINNIFVISRDSIVEKVAEHSGLTYNELFSNPQDENEKKKIKELNKIIDKTVISNFEKAINSDKDIVVDMTNLSKNTRRKALSKIQGKEAQFEKVAVLFTFMRDDLISAIKKIAQHRSKELELAGKPKNITSNLIDQMVNSYEPPSLDEGFDRIEVINDSNRILKQIKNI